MTNTISNNAMIRKIEYKIMELKEKKREITSKYLPKIDIGYKYAWSDSEDEDSKSENETIGMEIKIPFASEYVSTKNLRLAIRSRIQGARFKLIDKKNSLKEYIIQTSMDVENSYKKVDNNRKFYAKKEKELNNHRVKQIAKEITMQSFLEKKIEYLNAKKGYLLSLLDYNIRLISLNKSIY